jgi:hypothetical protein
MPTRISNITSINSKNTSSQIWSCQLVLFPTTPYASVSRASKTFRTHAAERRTQTRVCRLFWSVLAMGGRPPHSEPSTVWPTALLPDVCPRVRAAVRDGKGKVPSLSMPRRDGSFPERAGTNGLERPLALSLRNRWNPTNSANIS